MQPIKTKIPLQMQRDLAYPKGFEPSAYRVGVCHSIQLSYGYIFTTTIL